MSRLSNSVASPRTFVGFGSAPGPSGDLNVLCINLARSMIGRTVDLLVDAKTITHGVVLGVFTEAGMPKLVVNGLVFDPHQVLTVTPTSFN